MLVFYLRLSMFVSFCIIIRRNSPRFQILRADLQHSRTAYSMLRWVLSSWQLWKQVPNPLTLQHQARFFLGSTFTPGIGRDRFHNAPVLRVQNALAGLNCICIYICFERKEWHSSTAMSATSCISLQLRRLICWKNSICARCEPSAWRPQPFNSQQLS